MPQRLRRKELITVSICLYKMCYKDQALILVGSHEKSDVSTVLDVQRWM